MANKLLPLTINTVKSLPNGIYAVFANKTLIETIGIENSYKDNSKCHYPISQVMGSDEPYEIKSYIKNLKSSTLNKFTEYTITLASNIEYGKYIMDDE